MKILVIEDDLRVSEAIRDALRFRHTVELATTGQEGLRKADQFHYDIIILDVNLPDTNGLEVCQQIRSAHNQVPILVLTAETHPDSIVTMLDAGADDYLTKPFGLNELQARLRALLRRPPVVDQPRELRFGDLMLSAKSGQVTYQGQELPLRRKEFQILEYLMRHQGQVVSREMLFDQIWGEHSDPFTNTIDVHVKMLRDKVDRRHQRHYIRTVYGMGYKFDPAG